MTDAENPRAVMGANNPPDTDPLLIEAAERVDIANRYLTERSDLDKWDAEVADKANFFIGQVRATHQALDNQRKDENRAWEAKQKAKYAGPLDLLTRAKDGLDRLRRGYLQREEARLAAEAKRKADEAKRAGELAAEIAAKAEAEMQKRGGDPLRAQQQADEAAAKAAELAAAAAEAPVTAQIKGHYSSKASGLRTQWGARITDLSAAFRHYNNKKHPAKDGLNAAIEAYILSVAKKEAVATKDVSKAPPGVEFYSERV